MFCNIQFVIIFTCLLLATKAMYYRTRMIIIKFNGNVCHFSLFRIIHTNLPNFLSWLLPSLGYETFTSVPLHALFR